MRKTQQGRKFPYYIVETIDEKNLRMLILDLNSIQNRVFEDDKRYTTTYVDDKSAHDKKWIDVPGSTKAEKNRIIDWIKDMVFPAGLRHPDKYMVYDHRRHNTDPFHEEYKVTVFREYEAANFNDEEEEEEDPDEYVEDDVEEDDVDDDDTEDDEEEEE